MHQLLFRNARVFDGYSDDCADGVSILVAEGVIQQISEGEIKAPQAQVVDVGGRTLMPGMFDCHVHAFASDIAVRDIESAGEAYRTAHAMRMLRHALYSGFTTVRDVGGGNYSLYRALADELSLGPRYFYAGKALSMTGGHGDFRQLEEAPRYESVCSCAGSSIFNSLCVVADGIDECIKAAREQLRQGAHCVKIMGSGGIASPTDPIWMNQYREDEIRAIVNECKERNTYVTAHCHPTAAIRRCVEFGVRCIEHGTLIDRETAEFVASNGTYIVPTLVVLEQLAEMGRKMHFPPRSQEKAEFAWRSALSGMDVMRSTGVRMCFGTDLLGSLYDRQCREFTLRKEIFKPVEILRQATSVSAEMMMQDGKLGCVREGAHADLLVVDGDPLADISLLEANGDKLSVICKAGHLVKNLLS